MQSVSSRIWTRVVVSISYDDNHCTTGTPNIMYKTNLLHQNIFYIEIKKNIKQTLINNGFPNYIFDEQIKCIIKNVS